MGATVFFQSANELATLTNTFKVNGTLTDPTAVTLTITDPQAAVTTYTTGQLTHTGTGVYTKDIACSVAGEWTYEWEGTTAASDATIGTWTVQDTALGRLYCTVEALKSRLGIALTDTIDDYELHGACFSASRWLEQYCGRVFWRGTSEARTFEPANLYWLKLPEYCDLVSATTIKTDASGDGVFETTWQATDFQLHPVNPQAGPETRPYTKVKAVGTLLFPLPVPTLMRTDLVQITGVWGWPGVPAAVKEAAKVLAAELFKLKDAPFGVAGFGDLGLIRIRDNPKVAALAGPYQRTPWLGA